MKKLDWTWKEFWGTIVGTFLFTFGVNVFIIPQSLYNGNLLGISQLIRTLLVNILPFTFPFDISGIICYLFNIPLLIMAYIALSRSIFWKTILCSTVQTIFLTFIPIPTVPILADKLTSCIIGGLLVGYGCGLVLRFHCTGGGTDILGLFFTHRYSFISVGKLSMGINVVVYSICALTQNVETAIYSIIYATVTSLVIDRVHSENICSEALIVSKESPEKIIQFIVDQFHRTATTWEAIGGYDGSTVHIILVVLSKYELRILERYLHATEGKIFLVKKHGVGVEGRFEKKLF